MATSSQHISIPDAVDPRARSKRWGMSRRRWLEATQGYLFITPWLVGFLIFTLGPMLASFYYSFTHYNVQTSPRFTGLYNFDYAFNQDPLFWVSVQRTLLWSVITVVPSLI